MFQALNTLQFAARWMVRARCLSTLLLWAFARSALWQVKVMVDHSKVPNSGTERSVGTSPLRREDPRFLTGRGRYLADVSLPRMSIAAFIRSDLPDAHVRGIDIRSALGVPGVEAILTANDLPRATLWLSKHPNMKVTRQPVLAADRVRFVGEPLAIVVAENRYAADDASELVTVDYEPIDGSKIPLFDHIPDNVVFRESKQWGEIDRAFSNATKIVSSSFRNARQLACPLEARGCIASFDPFSRELMVWASTQVPHRLRSDLAAAVGLPESRIRIVMQDIGGGFGQKIPTHVEEVTVALASMKLGKPVKWVEDRRENLVAAPHSRDQEIKLELALNDSCQFLGLRAVLVGDAGAYSFNSGTCLTEAYRAAQAIPGGYKIGAYSYDVTIRLSNKSPIAPYRGIGDVAGNCARELLIDKAAREFGIDRFELRERNMIRSKDLPCNSIVGWPLSEVSFLETMSVARRQFACALREMGPPPEGTIRGIGIGNLVEASGAGPGFQSHDAARVAIDRDGKATITFGAPSIGQGIETTMAQIAADSLGLALDDVAVSWTDTAHAPLSIGGTRASRTAIIIGGAVGRAAQAVRQQILEVAAVLLQASVNDLVTTGGKIWRVGDDAPKMSVAELVRIGVLRTGLPPGMEPTFEATKSYSSEKSSFSNASIVAAILVWPETGEVQLERIIAAEDCGVMINPMIVEGQFVGGVVQGIGMALLEQFVYDENGQPITGSFMDYALPTAKDTIEVEMTHIITPSSANWEGVKGMGEGGCIAGANAIVSAVADALAQLGAEVDSMPMTRTKIWSMLQLSAPQILSRRTT